MEENYIVYVKTDAQSRIVAVNSSGFIADAADWTKIDEGTGDKYHHAQGNYFEMLLTNPDGTHNYKFVDGIVIETNTQEQLEELTSMPSPAPTANERIVALENALLTIMGGNIIV